MNKKLLRIILSGLIFLFLSNLHAYSDETQLILIENERASKVIGLLQEAKALLSNVHDRYEVNLLNLLQRNLTKKYIVLNLYTANVENKVEEFLSNNIYRRTIKNPMPILIKKKKIRKKTENKPKKIGRNNTSKNIRGLKAGILK